METKASVIPDSFRKKFNNGKVRTILVPCRKLLLVRRIFFAASERVLKLESLYFLCCEEENKDDYLNSFGSKAGRIKKTKDALKER